MEWGPMEFDHLHSLYRSIRGMRPLDARPVLQAVRRIDMEEEQQAEEQYRALHAMRQNVMVLRAELAERRFAHLRATYEAQNDTAHQQALSRRERFHQWRLERMPPWTWNLPWLWRGWSRRDQITRFRDAAEPRPTLSERHDEMMRALCPHLRVLSVDMQRASLAIRRHVVVRVPMQVRRRFRRHEEEEEEGENAERT
ncbi:hypothetical protein SEUCBS139899_004869 [Sporothrix eucalyptigena]